MQFIIDEGVTKSSATYKAVLRWLAGREAFYIFVSKEHRGISDTDIIEKLLPLSKNLVTKDRILHNRAIAMGFNSLILDEYGTLTNQKISYVSGTRALPLSLEKDLQVSAMPNPYRENCPFTNILVNTLSQKNIERMRLKRKRICSYFNDESNIKSVEITIVSEAHSGAEIGGYTIQINAKNALKPLKNASVGYCLDETTAHILSPVMFALTHLYSLYLKHVPITIYLSSPDALERCQKIKMSDQEEGSIERVIKLMFNHIPKIEFKPCLKGFFYDHLQNKLNQIKYEWTNDLVILDFQLIAELILKN